MGKALARNYVITPSNRPRKASNASLSPYAAKLACNWPKCTKTFGRKGDLKRHEQLHTGIRKHDCPRCGKMFSQNSGLKTHMNVHTGDKPYRCDYDGCEAEFGDPSSHARHKKETHQVDYRYKCPYEGCPSAIKRRSAFAAHLVKHGIVLASDEFESLRQNARPATQRRKSIQHNFAAMTAPSSPFYYVDPVDVGFIHTQPDTQYMKPFEEHSHLLPIRGTFHDNKPEPGYPFYSNHPHHLEPYFTAPLENLSNISAQSSTKTLVGDLPYDDNHDKLFYNEIVVDHVQMINPMHFTRSFPSSRTTSPFKEDGYRLSSLPIPVQEPMRMGSHTAFDRQRYIPIPMAGNPISYPYDPKLLSDGEVSRAKDHHLSSPTHHQAINWEQWGFT